MRGGDAMMSLLYGIIGFGIATLIFILIDKIQNALIRWLHYNRSQGNC